MGSYIYNIWFYEVYYTLNCDLKNIFSQFFQEGGEQFYNFILKVEGKLDLLHIFVEIYIIIWHKCIFGI